MNAAEKRTEAEMLAMLRARYTEKAGNGDAWAFIPHVRNAAGFNANRTADAIAMSLWPSRGLLLHGFEVKVSRSDWLRELKAPDKAESFCAIVDRWWLVVADSTIVQPGELPDTWGLLVAKGSRLVCQKEAPALRHSPAPMSRSFLAALLRSACRVPEAGAPEIAEAVAAERASMEEIYEQRLTYAEERNRALVEKVEAFQRESGVAFESWSIGRDPAETGRALRLVLAGEHEIEQTENRLRSLATQARRVADDLDSRLAAGGRSG